MSSPLTDTEIIRQVLQGDRRAYSVLVARYQNLVFTMVLRYVNNREEAEELAQDVFVKAFRALADFRSEAKFSTWLYTITNTTCLSFLRLKKRPVVLLEPEQLISLDRSDSTGTVYEQRARQEWINHALQELPEMDAQIVTLFYQAGQSIEEIGKILGMTPGNVKIRLFRARQKLKDILQHHLAHEAQDLYRN